MKCGFRTTGHGPLVGFRGLDAGDEDGDQFITLQELLGHEDVSTTMIYTHVMMHGSAGTASPLDTLDAITPEEFSAAIAATRSLSMTRQ